MEVRCEDLAQTRPEFGNASNAICFVGRRGRTRGLYLDRRCFQNSYDPTQDNGEYAILARILAAAVPVCEGINMQYYLSYVDSPGWACGTKLPHNVTSLLGVMNGAASDLRPGLPWQSVEIHEPVRLLFVIETTPEGMLLIMERNPMVGNILKNAWAQLAVLDPHSSEIQLYDPDDHQFHVYQPEATELAQGRVVGRLVSRLARPPGICPDRTSAGAIIAVRLRKKLPAYAPVDRTSGRDGRPARR